MPKTITQRLQSANITEAAIIDETFDGISNEVIEKDLQTFIAALGRDDVLQEARAICGGLEEPEDFDLDCAKTLWVARNSWGGSTSS